jgi:chromate transporter
VVAALFAGLAPAVLAIVTQALWRIGRRALTHVSLVLLALVAFAALTVFAVPFPVVVLGAGVAGWSLNRWRPGLAASGHDGGRDDAAALLHDESFRQEHPSRGRAVRILAIGLPLWLAPVGLAALLSGGDSTYTQQGLFFSGTALVTFGGAYAVLAFVADRAVDSYGWLMPGEMARGLALAESTPGPLIMVVQFVAFLGAYRDPGGLDPWVAGLVASLLVTWVTFVPSFLFIFLGAPYVERLRGNVALAAALTGITAAVVGVIGNLAVFFAVHTLFAGSADRTWGPVQLLVPELSTLRWDAVLITAAAGWLLFGIRWSVLRTLGVCALLGLALGLLS